MKALVLEEYNKLVYKDVSDPVISNDEVLVKVIRKQSGPDSEM